ncbi:hypothetical protein IZ6_14110 [Terrihabitans soli]|uniref:Class I SAM-dependent methyltransferase n=1 Tax=Terrihabitans soli TaxID=708113 RepID=A0A6S6QMS5_9HYPH|nr:hypothetical protein [Terrihabitans soli]BCJ90676.1 hypothetical protein IZ6_14110 [Terrihabitans soli]
MAMTQTQTVPKEVAYQSIAEGWQMRMTVPEMEAYRHALRGTKCLVEFGCGGSTIFAAQMGVSEIYCVDSDADWIKRVSSSPEIAQSGVRLSARYADIGPVGNWGSPQDERTKARWPNYHSQIWNEVRADTVDCLLIDGRFRVACTLQALLRVGSQTKLAFHDFWEREHYHVVLPFLNICEKVDTLLIATPKAGLIPANLYRYLNPHMFDPR